MPDIPSWIKDYVPLTTALAALVVATFQYFTARPKTKLEMEKIRLDIEKARVELERVSESTKTNADNISEIQNTLIEQLPIYQDETLVYSNKTGNIGFDFEGKEGYVDKDGKIISKKGEGRTDFLGKGIINIERSNMVGRYELYLRSYLLGAKKNKTIIVDPTEDSPKRFRVSCEARTTKGDHTLRFVMRDPTTFKWIGKSVVHRLTSPEWKRIEAHFQIPPLQEAELRIDDEDITSAPSGVQIRKLQVTQRNIDWLGRKLKKVEKTTN